MSALALLQIGSLELGANPINTVIVLGLLSLLPFLLMMATSFLKFAVVLSILRNSLGTHQVPPTPVIMGLSVVLTIYVMSPVASQVRQNLRADLAVSSDARALSGQGAQFLLLALEKSKPPMRVFLQRHAHAEEVELFFHWARQMGPQEWKEELRQDDLIVLLPAFAISELTEAFAIGFLLFLPFLVIDMVVSNLLLTMGMHMLSPVMVSLPFKLLLFIMVDGWTLVSRGLLQSYL